MEIKLLGYKIRTIDMLNLTVDNQTVKIQESSKMKVKYSLDMDSVLAEFHVNVMLEGHDDVFHINLMIEGLFEIMNDEDIYDKKQIHTICYDELFPYASQIVNQLALNGGIAGFLLKKQPILPEDIEFVQSDYKTP